MAAEFKLRDLLAAVSLAPAIADHSALDGTVKGLSTNSKTCQPGDLFIGMPGTRVDGGEFWRSAIEGGAIAAIISPEAAKNKPLESDDNTCLIIAEDVVGVCGKIAAAFYDDPTQTLQLVGVTGTNGKTTTSQLVEYFLGRCGRSPALFGTLVNRWPGYEKTAVNTTPFAVELQGQLAAARDAGADSAVMEVSSHGLHQRRVAECKFQVAVFTNLTQDHLDYHGTMDAYFEAKALLFSSDYLTETGRGIINIDSDYGQKMVDKLPKNRRWTYSVDNEKADFYLTDLAYQLDGVTGQLHGPDGQVVPFSSPLVGQFNLENVLAAIASGLHLGLELVTMVNALAEFPGVPGRMQRVAVGYEAKEQDISVIVDYAHTPDSLDNALRAARPFVANRLICVFGCGGDRDRTKRPLMGNIAAAQSDWAVVTSDNPRTEDPQQILNDVVEGIGADANSVVIGDRAEAIRTAILDAQPGDCVLIAGKGHEDYQILGTEKIHFDDREQARDALRLRLG
ncbi:MAG: UDP-N-acetylmuramoyl-L-alanyl-D-glutamate--2,6-diaminopimelate ligase [Cyanobacteria bacterium P01_C01_bin.89]